MTNSTQKKKGVGIAAVLVVACMMLCTVSPAIMDWNENFAIAESTDPKPNFNYVALGDSMVNGFGYADYYVDPEETFFYNKDNKDGSKTNAYGFLQDVENTYPYLLKGYLKKEYGYTVNEDYMLAISGMRSAEMRSILSGEQIDYEKDIWETNITEAMKFLPKGYDQNNQGLTDYYIHRITEANLVTYNFHYDFGWTFRSALMDFAETGETQEFNFEAYLDDVQIEKIEELKDYIGNAITQIFAELGIDISAFEDLLALADMLMEAVAFVILGYCINFDKNMEMIFDLNEDVNVVVIDSYNTFKDMYIGFEDFEIPLGDVYGLVLDVVNMYTRHISPYAEMTYHTTVDGDPCLFADEFVNSQGISSSVSNDAKRGILYACGVWETSGESYDTLVSQFDFNNNLTLFFQCVFETDVLDYAFFTGMMSDSKKMEEFNTKTEEAIKAIRTQGADVDRTENGCSVDDVTFDKNELSLLWFKYYVDGAAGMLSHPCATGHEEIYKDIIENTTAGDYNPIEEWIIETIEEFTVAIGELNIAVEGMSETNALIESYGQVIDAFEKFIEAVETGDEERIEEAYIALEEELVEFKDDAIKLIDAIQECDEFIALQALVDLKIAEIQMAVQPVIEDIIETLKELGEFFEDVIEFIEEEITKAIELIEEFIQQVIAEIEAAIAECIENLEEILEEIRQHIVEIVEYIQMYVFYLVLAFTTFVDTIENSVIYIQGIIEQFGMYMDMGMTIPEILELIDFSEIMESFRENFLMIVESAADLIRSICPDLLYLIVEDLVDFTFTVLDIMDYLEDALTYKETDTEYYVMGGNSIMYLGGTLADDNSGIRLMDIVELMGGSKSDGRIVLDKYKEITPEMIMDSNIIVLETDAGNLALLLNDLINMMGNLPVEDLDFSRFEAILGNDVTKWLNEMDTYLAPIIEKIKEMYPGNEELIEAIEIIEAMVERVLYNRIGSICAMIEAEEIIHSINPEITIMFTGCFNPLEGVSFSVGDDTFEMGGILDMINLLSNRLISEFCEKMDHTVFVPLSHVETRISHDYDVIPLQSIAHIIATEYGSFASAFLPTEYGEMVVDHYIEATLDKLDPIYTHRYVTFYDDDGTVLKDTELVKCGELPVAPKDPVKEADAQYTYTFAGWSPEIAPVESELDEGENPDIIYIATYNATVNEYTVTWELPNGTVLDTETLEYGDVPEYKSGTPAMPPKDGHVYEFIGWQPAIAPVTGDVRYVAQFYETVIIPPVTDGEITIDASDIPDTVNEVVVSTGDINMSISGGIFKNLPAGATVKVYMEFITHEDLPAKYREFAHGKTVLILDMTVNGREISDFGSEHVMVSFKYTPEAGVDTSKLTVWCMDEKSDTAVEHPAVYDADRKTISFISNHLSFWFVGVDVSDDPVDGQDGNPYLTTVVIALAVMALIGLCVVAGRKF